jgi:hypothetical protein
MGRKKSTITASFSRPTVQLVPVARSVSYCRQPNGRLGLSSAIAVGEATDSDSIGPENNTTTSDQAMDIDLDVGGDFHGIDQGHDFERWDGSDAGGDRNADLELEGLDTAQTDGNQSSVSPLVHILLTLSFVLLMESPAVPSPC